MSWNWQSQTCEARKRILVPGTICERPADASICNLTFSESTCQEIPNGNRDIKIGQGDTEAERRLELIVCTMVAGEEAIADVGGASVKVKLESVIRGKELYEMTDEEKLRLAAEHKERGTCLVMENRFDDAYKRFQKAIRILVFLGREEEPQASLFAAVCSNIVLCHLKSNRFDDAILAANKVLEKKPDNVKVLLRRALARQELRDFENAQQDLLDVLRLEPNNVLATSHLQDIKREISEQNVRYEDMVKKMFPFTASKAST
ncbi:FK506 Hypothetical protein protein like [Nesidiocoris tenuis]|uniref:BDBT FKBP like N-terminal domain-containing protein n=1 Tax=Nesidiocoris tenuis TaxID=355587 RepID=A0ABN7BBE6_9HEMI|nr:FK506 Hypothetical protein protein like [Nesidiocoris tenuis]